MKYFEVFLNIQSICLLQLRVGGFAAPGKYCCHVVTHHLLLFMSHLHLEQCISPPFCFFVFFSMLAACNYVFFNIYFPLYFCKLNKSWWKTKPVMRTAGKACQRRWKLFIVV